MTVYNGETYLREAIESILDQTYRAFTFLIIDNASTDNSLEIIQSYDDSRIKLVPLPQNIGQIPALNKGLDMIQTPLVARMDADDISLPLRFEQQVNFLDDHPEIAVCGTYAAAFMGKKETLWKHPVKSEDINVRLLLECCLAHPSVMMRKDLLDLHHFRYDETLGHSEDWDLWQRISRIYPLANIPNVLLRYRVHNQSVSSKTLDLQQNAAAKLDEVSLEALDLHNHRLRHIHRDVGFETFNAKNREQGFIQDVMEWFQLLQQRNESRKIYSQQALENFLKERLFIVLTNNTRQGMQALKPFLNHKLYRIVPLSWTLKFMAKLLIRK